jgi:hypothetical protein
MPAGLALMLMQGALYLRRAEKLSGESSVIAPPQRLKAQFLGRLYAMPKGIA